MNLRFRTLMWKELHENARCLPVGIIVVAACIWYAYPKEFSSSKFLARELATLMSIALPMLAFALGIVQSYRDLQSGPNVYLQHREVTDLQTFSAKVLAGFAIYAVAVFVPLALLATYLAWTGMYWHPVRPAQVVPSCVLAMAAFLFHPVAILMLARQASWWGTKVLPVIWAANLYFPISVAIPQGGLTASAWSIAIVSVAGILYLLASYQGWRDMVTDPPRNEIARKASSRKALNAVLIVSSLGVLFLAGFLILAAIENVNASRNFALDRFNEVVIDANSGEPWLISRTYQWDHSASYSENVKFGAQMVDGEIIDPLQDLPNSLELQPFSSLVNPSSAYYSQGDGFFNSVYLISSGGYIYDQRGYLLGYESRFSGPPLSQIIAADGIYPAGPVTGKPFTTNVTAFLETFSNELVALGYPALLIDDQGVFALRDDVKEITQLIKAPIDHAAMLFDGPERLIRLLIVSDDEMFLYGFTDPQAPEEWIRATSTMPITAPVPRRTVSRPFDMKRIHRYRVPKEAIFEPGAKVASANADLLFTRGYSIFKETEKPWVIRVAPNDGVTPIRTQIAPGRGPSVSDNSLSEIPVPSLVPPGVWTIGIIIVSVIEMMGQRPNPVVQTFQENPVPPFVLIALVALILLFSWLFVRRLARARGLSRRQTTYWSFATLFLGLATPLSLVAIYPKLFQEPCPSCGKPRRIDLEACEQCGTTWPPATLTGIEVIDDLGKPTESTSDKVLV